MNMTLMMLIKDTPASAFNSFHHQHIQEKSMPGFPSLQLNLKFPTILFCLNILNFINPSLLLVSSVPVVFFSGLILNVKDINYTIVLNYNQRQVIPEWSSYQWTTRCLYVHTVKSCMIWSWAAWLMLRYKLLTSRWKWRISTSQLIWMNRCFLCVDSVTLNWMAAELHKVTK